MNIKEQKAVIVLATLLNILNEKEIHYRCKQCNTLLKFKICHDKLFSNCTNTECILYRYSYSNQGCSSLNRVLFSIYKNKYNIDIKWDYRCTDSFYASKCFTCRADVELSITKNKNEVHALIIKCSNPLCEFHRTSFYLNKWNTFNGI